MNNTQLNAAETAKRIVDDLLLDLNGRSGGDDFWYSIDSETRREFVATWRGLVAQALAQYDPASPNVYASWIDEEAGEAYPE